MSTDQLTSRAAVRLGRLARPVTIALLVVLGIGALAGGIALIAAPDGSIMGFQVSLLEGSPFPDYLVPGLILGGLFGVGSFVVAGLGVLDHPIAPVLAFAIGCGQMLWIIIQLAIIGTENLSFLHPAMFLVGLAIAVAAVPWGWPVVRAWRERSGGAARVS